MSYKLVIAEKLSVAQSIAKVIGADRRGDGYLEGNGYLVSWCVGHLVELAPPEAYDEKYEKWRYSDLPILPSEWKYQISDATIKQFGILKKLMEREDVTGLVKATDAGREGELIFRLVYNQAKCKKPFERLWISSMEDQAISDGFSNLQNGKKYDDLYRAALCRERADWSVGMNATRLFSTLYGQTLNVERVMTPTLAMIVQREAEIESFKPEPIYRLSISCGGITAVSDRFEKKEDAENVLKVLEEQKTAQVIKIDPADKQEKAPQLYSLTALQRDANRFLGFTAQQTLDYTQSLFEKKLVTYPRTDSRFLTEDMENMIPDLARKMASRFGYTKNISVYPKQVINNSKVSDHHAIIPTVNVTDTEFGKLPSGEQKVLSLITARLLSALGESAVRSEVDVEFTCADTVFKTKTKNLTKKGWREIQDWIMGSSMDSENDKEEKSGNANMLACIAMLTNGKSYPLQNYSSVEEAILNSPLNAENEEFSVPEDFLNHVDEILHIWNGKQYDTIFYRAGSDNNPVQGFVMARCKKQVEEASVQYAFMNATPVTTKADSILISDITELIRSSLKLSDFQQDLNPNYPDTRFVFGYAHDKEIYSLEVEGQKPDGVIEINVYDRTMYLWYYDDLKSDKRGNNLSYSVDVPE